MTVAQLCEQFSVAPGQIYAWKKQLENCGEIIFADKRFSENQKNEIEKLHKLIGKLSVERDFLAHVLDR